MKSDTVWIDNARIVAIFAVVFLHVSGAMQTNGANDEWIIQSYLMLSKWCVPFFVIVSGSSLLLREQKERIVSFYRKRIVRVVIPTFFWSTALILQTYLSTLHSEEKSSILGLALGSIPVCH